MKKLILLLVVVAGCAKPIGECDQDADCKSGEICIQGGSCKINCGGMNPVQCSGNTTCQITESVAVGLECRNSAECNANAVDVCE